MVIIAAVSAPQQLIPAALAAISEHLGPLSDLMALAPALTRVRGFATWEGVPTALLSQARGELLGHCGFVDVDELLDVVTDQLRGRTAIVAL